MRELGRASMTVAMLARPCGLEEHAVRAGFLWCFVSHIFSYIKTSSGETITYFTPVIRPPSQLGTSTLATISCTSPLK